MTPRTLPLLAALALASCTPDVCSDIECVMAHMTLSINGRSSPLTAVAAAGVPAPTSAPETMSAGDFQLLITPLSAPNWADPVQLIEAGAVAQGPSSPNAALAPSITNRPGDLSFASTSSEESLTLAWVDPNAATPAFCFTPYDGKNPYPHCVWCTAQERDLANAGVANLRLGINAGITSPIDFKAPTGRACSNPTRPDGTMANPMRGCPTGSKPCGRGCIPTSGLCCGSAVGDTSSYCTNAAGGTCRVGVRCDGSENCCDGSGSFGSTDCGPNEHHCGLQCTSIDRPCCPPWSKDPQCGVPLLAGAGVAVGVEAPASGGGGGGGGGGSPGDTCGYAGKYRGVFKYAVTTGDPPREVKAQLVATFTLEHKLTASGLAILDITSVTIDDTSFGATSATKPVSPISIATLPCGTPPMGGAGLGFLISLSNGGNLATANDAGVLQISADRRTFTSSTDPRFANDTWTAGTGRGDSNTPGSGPGGYAYNGTRFESFVITKQ